ncbi:MAG: HD domain-containing protein [Lachnospiraceae bacterium]|nr:HD domain-containing protein [Lachnospiraceae bacterium]
MENNRVLIKNEKQANHVVAMVMCITFAIFTFIYILDIIGIFILDFKIMTIAYVGSGVLLLLPMLLVDVLKKDDGYIKYLNVMVAVLFTTLLSITVTYHAIVIYVYPIAIASLYFSRRLNIIATIFTVAGVSIGQVAAFYLDTIQDNNFLTLDYVLVFGVLPRALVLIAIAAIFTVLASRTARLLRSLLDAETGLKQFHKEMVMGFATLVENKDGSTGGHIKRTTTYVKLLAEELRNRGHYSEELTDEYLENLYRAAPMHDIGKISVPDVVLQKPGKLTDEEFEIIKQHTVSGGRIVKETFGHLENEDYTKMAYEVARFHHEKWNGKGYPDGLKEEEIPLCARIMAIADVFDAVSEKRCYRDAMPLEKCFSIIEEGRGQAFEPLLVDVFLDIRSQVESEHERVNN